MKKHCIFIITVILFCVVFVCSMGFKRKNIEYSKLEKSYPFVKKLKIIDEYSLREDDSDDYTEDDY